MKFTIRDLFWLLLVCAIAAGWFANRRFLINRIRDLEEQVQDRAIVHSFSTSTRPKLA
jgi:hypothetical protein